jgi:Icc-related predicted phosphoesterase
MKTIMDFITNGKKAPKEKHYNNLKLLKTMYIDPIVLQDKDKIINQLFMEADWLFDENKISAIKYDNKITQLLKLQQTIWYLQQTELNTQLALSKELQKQTEKQTHLEFENQYLKACVILMGGIIENPFYKPLEESEKQFKQEVIKLLYKAQKPLRWIDIQHAAHLQMFVNTFEQGINECKAILVEKYGEQKAAQLWEESGKRIQAA